MRVVAVVEDHIDDQASCPYLVDLDMLPEDHTYRKAVDEVLNDNKQNGQGMGGTIATKYSLDYRTKDKDVLAARLSLPFTGTIVGLVKIFTD